MPLCDTALRLAQKDVYAIRWTQQILEEAERNLIDSRRFDPEKIKRRFVRIRQEFADAEVTGHEDLIPAMHCHDKDRHVLAAGVRGGAHQIVTANVRDFPEDSLEPYGIEVVTPDDFLLNSLDMATRLTTEVIAEQAAQLRKPPMSIPEVLAALSKAGAPLFAQAMENILTLQQDKGR